MKARWFWARTRSHAAAAAVVVGLLFGGVMAASVQTGLADPGASAVQASTGAAGQAPIQTVAQAGKGVQPTPSSGPREGIKVHGHWIIEVRKPNGELVSRREFDNALASGASTTLAGFLSRDNSVGLWVVKLEASPGPQPCASGGFDLPCEIHESGSVYAGPSIFKTLSVAIPTSGPNAGRLVLSGTATAQATSRITAASTLLGLCPKTEPPGCASAPWAVTATALRSPQDVVAGQIVQVTVVISFS